MLIVSRILYWLAVSVAGGLCSCVVGPGATTGASESVASTGSPTALTTTGGTNPDEPTSGSATTAAFDNTSAGGSTTADANTTTGGPVCGDGVVDLGEDCDDSNKVENDGCLSNCVLGAGGALPALPLPAPAKDEYLRCFTAVDADLLGGDTHALVLGSERFNFGPVGQVGTQVRRIPLPDATPAAWAFLEYAGDFGRRPLRAVTADNGDVIIVGVVYTEQQKPDSGGYSWRARFAPDGMLVWNHEDPSIPVFASGITLTPQGDLVVAGTTPGFSPWPLLHIFGPDGALKAEFADPGVPGYASGYSDVTVDDDGNIYVLGTRVHNEATDAHLFLQRLSPDAKLQWNTEQASPMNTYVSTASLVLTADDVLLAAVRQYDDPVNWKVAGPLGLAAFTTDGAEMWWKVWSPPAPWHPLGGTLVAAIDGGVFIAGSLVTSDDQATFSARLNADSTTVWANITPGEPVQDALLGPDGLFYVLTQTAIVPHLP